MRGELFFGGIEKIFKKPNPQKSEHLKNGVKPIIVCVGNPKQFREKPNTEDGKIFSDLMKLEDAHNVDFYENPDELDRKGFKNKGQNSYVISKIDGRDKLSEEYRDCTGLLVVGADKETGENISFLTHQMPEYFLGKSENKNLKFKKDLSKQIEELKKRSQEGTIDAVILGGQYLSAKSGRHSPAYKEMYMAEHEDSIKLLAKEVSKSLGFEPVVIVGPKEVSENNAEDDIFFSNSERRLYLKRPEVGMRGTESYLPSEIKKQAKKWE